MSTAPPGKRHPTQDDPEAASNQDDSLKKSYLWFEDGNVVLQAENTLFRVQQTDLALHSEFFCDMFSICQSPDDGSQPMFEAGCPLVSTSDSATDLTCLLSHIYEKEKKHNLGEEVEVTRTIALYRLGDKYGIDHLRDDILLRLKTAFPSILQDFQRLREHKKTTFLSAFQDLVGGHKSTMCPFGKLELKDLIPFANFAHEFGILIVLPAIYVRLSRLSNAALLLARNCEPVALNPEVVNTCLIGKENMASAIQKAIFSRAGRCKSIRACNRRPRCATTTSAILWQIGIAVCEQGIWCFDVERFRGSSNLCEKCMQTVLTTEYQPMLQELWENLPPYFGLPTWEELKSATS